MVLCIALLLSVFGCQESQNDDKNPFVVSDTTNVEMQKTALIAKDTTNKHERENNLFVFVGEKISVTELPQDEDSRDHGFQATYKILDRVYGNYSKDTIHFEAYDHYGTPPFSKYKHTSFCF